MTDPLKVAVQVATSDEEVPPGAEWRDWVAAALDAAQDALSRGAELNRSRLERGKVGDDTVVVAIQGATVVANDLAKNGPSG